MRYLFRLFFFVLFVSTIYFILQQTKSPEPSKQQNWVKIKNQSGLELSFPTKPVQLSRTRAFPGLGKHSVYTYQSSMNNQAYVLLILAAKFPASNHTSIKELGKTVHLLNDTRDLHISQQRYFQYHNLPAVEYLAMSDKKSTALWCRTIHTGTALLSLIYIHTPGKNNINQRDRFFNSLKLPG